MKLRGYNKYFISFEGSSKKMSLLTAQQLDLTDEGYASELTALNSSVIYTTVYGHVVGLMKMMSYQILENFPQN